MTEAENLQIGSKLVRQQKKKSGLASTVSSLIYILIVGSILFGGGFLSGYNYNNIEQERIENFGDEDLQVLGVDEDTTQSYSFQILSKNRNIELSFETSIEKSISIERFERYAKINSENFNMLITTTDVLFSDSFESIEDLGESSYAGPLFELSPYGQEGTLLYSNDVRLTRPGECYSGEEILRFPCGKPVVLISSVPLSITCFYENDFGIQACRDIVTSLDIRKLG